MESFDHYRRKMKREERDGVVYEPGSYSGEEGRKGAGAFAAYARGGRAGGAALARDKTRSAPQKSQFALFYIITLLTGVVVCIVIFAIVFSSIMKNRPYADNIADNTKVDSAPPAAEEIAPAKDLMEIVGVLADIDVLSGQLKLIDVNSEKEFTVAVDGVTEMKNAYAQEMSFAEFSGGDIVSAAFNTKTGILKSMVIDAAAWKFRLIQGLNVDTEAYVMTIGSTRYVYDDKLTAVYQGKPAVVEDIVPIDLVTVGGYRDKVWFVEIMKSHGFIELLNKEKVQDGTLEVDTSIFMLLDDASRLEVQEGAHRVLIKGSNIEPYMKNVVISQGRLEIIDLSDIQYKSGVINIVANVTDFRLFINKKEYPANAPIVLDLGTYAVEARKDGYLPFETFIQVTEPAMDVPVLMTEEVVLRELSVATEPADAAVYINNGYVGRSPVTESLPDGKHTVTVRKDGYNDTTISVDVNENARLSYSITMHPRDPYALGATTTPSYAPAQSAPVQAAPAQENLGMDSLDQEYAGRQSYEALPGEESAPETEQTDAPVFESPLY